MKHALRSFLHAWLMAMLLVPATLSHGADAAPAPDYPTLVNGLFDQAAVCKIRGDYAVLKRHWIEFDTPDAQSLQKLRELFLLEKPRYLGTDIPKSLALDYPIGLQFIWYDRQGNYLGELRLMEGDKLVFDRTSLFTTSTPWTKNMALEQRVADFCSPEIAAERKQPKPDYHALIKAIFAKAASCKIEGYYFEYGARDINRDHKLDFSTSGTRELQELQDVFLLEKPYFEMNMGDKGSGKGYGYACNLYFTWFDAQGKKLSRVELLEGDNLYFVETHDMFCTSSMQFRNSGNENATFYIGIGRFVLPKIAKKTGQPVKSGGVKPAR